VSAPAAEVTLTAEQKLELEAATEIASLIRRVLDGARTFPPGHKTLVGYYEHLHERARALIGALHDTDELGLGVTPLGFKSVGQVLSPAENIADSFTHALFLDGVNQLILSAELTLPDLQVLIDIWRSTLDGKLGETHTFCTRFWEADLDTIHVNAVETFSEGMSTAEGKQKTELQTVVDNLTTGGGYSGSTSTLTGSSGIYVGSTSRVSHITRADLELLRANGIPELTEADLARFDAAERAAVEGLSGGELSQMAEDLAQANTLQIERATDALFQSGVRASPEELISLRRAFALVLGAMVKAGLIGRLKDLLGRRVLGARQGDPSELAARFEVLSQLMNTLLYPVVLEPLVVALDDEAQRPHVLAVLRFLPAHAASTLLSWLTVPELPVARRALADAIVAHGPAVDELVERLGWADEELAVELLHIANSLGLEPSWPVRKAALKHPSLAVRRAAVGQLPKEFIVQHKHELVPLLSSPEAEMRALVFAPLVSAKDPLVATALSVLLRKGKLEGEEWERVVAALGQLGGADACSALRHLLTQATGTEHKVALIHALAHAGDQAARPQLEELAGKLLGGGDAKKAAQLALKRLDFLKKGAGA
jgi:hypothetical protein